VEETRGQSEIRAVFLDIDGTLFYEGAIVESARRAVLKLLQRDLFVAICTGRSILHAKRIQRDLGLADAVYFNGGLAISNDRVVLSQPLSADVVGRVIQFSRRNQLPIILHTQRSTVIFEPFPDVYRPILEAYDFPPLERIELEHWQSSAEPVYQINVFMDRTWDHTVQNEFPECLLYRWDDRAVDLQKRGCDKVIGAKALLETWNVSPAVALHIGDGGNDIGMFRELGYSVAMGNASEEVKRHAKWVTTSAHEDGVYRALARLGIIS
jgi:Cof subfamily protein (haloacid dehalogenase superfamily)